MYTVWMYGRKIGQARLDTSVGDRRLAGVFHPTEFGLTVLPGITDMFPALIDFRHMCRRLGVDVQDPDPEIGHRAFEQFKNTAEGRRVVAAAKLIAAIDVCDRRGDDVLWDSLAISDMEALRTLALRECPDRAASLPPVPDTADIRYLISLTLADSSLRVVAMPC